LANAPQVNPGLYFSPSPSALRRVNPNKGPTSSERTQASAPVLGTLPGSWSEAFGSGSSAPLPTRARSGSTSSAALDLGAVGKSSSASSSPSAWASSAASLAAFGGGGEVASVFGAAGGAGCAIPGVGSSSPSTSQTPQPRRVA